MRKSARRGKDNGLRISCVIMNVTKALASGTPVSKLLLSLAGYRPWTIYFNPSKLLSIFFFLTYKVVLLYIMNVFIVSND